MRRLIYTIDYLPSGEVTPALSLCKRHMCLPPLPLSFPVGQASAAETLKSIARLAAAAAACSFAVPLNVRAHSAARGKLCKLSNCQNCRPFLPPSCPLSPLYLTVANAPRGAFTPVYKTSCSELANDRKSRLDMSEAKRRMSTTCKGVNEPFFRQPFESQAAAVVIRWTEEVLCI